MGTGGGMGDGGGRGGTGPAGATPLRWLLWTALGVLAALVVGFVLGLARPQVER